MVFPHTGPLSSIHESSSGTRLGDRLSLNAKRVSRPGTQDGNGTGEARVLATAKRLAIIHDQAEYSWKIASQDSPSPSRPVIRGHLIKLLADTIPLDALKGDRYSSSCE